MRKLKIKVRVLCEKCRPEIISKGEYIDLKARENHHYKGPSVDENGKVNIKSFMVPLGIAMQLPDGFEAVIIPRSSMYKNYGVMENNSIGLIDNTYCGNEDEWKLPVIAFKDGEIKAGERVCQFRIQLSQKATFKQKLNWLFSSGIELEYVDTLNNVNRGGFGSTGKA